MLPGEAWGHLRAGDTLHEIVPSPAGADDIDPADTAPAELLPDGTYDMRW